MSQSFPFEVGATVSARRAPPSAAEAARRGRMRIILMLHGGQQALSDVIEGLVVRNERALREGVVPMIGNAPPRLIASPEPLWRDAVTALYDGVGSTGTLAAWRCASERVKGRPARIAMVGGIPDVVFDDRGKIERLPPLVGSLSAIGPGVMQKYKSKEGRVEEFMLMTLDDDRALPVREVNDAIARHNARKIVQKKLPPLYKSGVKYEIEGSPELWLDYEEQLLQGHDDCEGLAATRAAELQNEGLESGVYTRFIATPPKLGGGRLFHAITWARDPKLGKIVYDDPSVRLGMKVPEWYLDFCEKARADGSPDF